jgi:NitT/TauT family transport system substrate-binding protein
MKRLLISLITLTLLVSCAPAGLNPTLPPGGIKIRLPVGYIPDVQFAPLYEAQEKGYFQQAGLEVTLDYSMETDAVALVGAGQTSFAIASGEQVLLARAQGLPVVYVTAWYQQYPVGVSSSTAEAIKTPADLKGKKIGLPVLSGASYIGLRALLDAGGLKETDVTLDTVGYNQVAALIAGREDAVVIYVNNEPLQLQAQGFPVITLRVADYLQLVGNGLITNEATIRQDPELVRRMATALVKGLQAALANPDEAYTICKKYVANLANADETVQKQVLSTSMELWKAPRIGFSQPQAWQNMQDIMVKMGLLKSAQDVSQAYSNSYIP